MDAAARSIVPGCEYWNVKEKWPKGRVKPDAAAMRREILRRGGSPAVRDCARNNERLCTWLHNNNVRPVEDEGGDEVVMSKPMVNAQTFSPETKQNHLLFC